MNRETRRQAEEILSTFRTPERRAKNVAVGSKEGPNKITKVQKEVLTLILEAVLLTIPDFDENNRLFIDFWDSGLYAVILKELTKEEAENIRKHLLELIAEKNKDESGVPIWEETRWLTSLDALIAYALPENS